MPAAPRFPPAGADRAGRADRAAAEPRARAAAAALRTYLDTSGTVPGPVDRAELDLVHEQIALLHQLLADLQATARPPNAADHLGTARLHLWHTTTHLHDAFHALPPRTTRRRADSPAPPGAEPCCRPDGRRPALGICLRQLGGNRSIRADATPTDLKDPVSGRIRHPVPPASDDQQNGRTL